MDVLKPQVKSLYLFCWQLCSNVEIFGHIRKSSKWFGIVRNLFFRRIIEFKPIFNNLDVLKPQVNSLYLFCWQLCCNVEIFSHIRKSSEWFGIVRIFGLFRTPIFPHHSKHFSIHIKLTICRFSCFYHKMTDGFLLCHTPRPLVQW